MKRKCKQGAEFLCPFFIIRSRLQPVLMALYNYQDYLDLLCIRSFAVQINPKCRLFKLTTNSGANMNFIVSFDKKSIF